MKFISDFFNWIMTAPMEAKLILAIGLGGIFIIWRMYKDHEEQSKDIIPKEIPKYQKRYMNK